MFVTNETSLTPSVRLVLQNNPFTKMIATADTDRANALRNCINAKEDLKRQEQHLVNLKVDINLYAQKEKQKTKELTALNKAMANSSSEFTCDFLRVEIMESFFNAIGLKFIHFTIDAHGEWATIAYVRPTRYIGIYPTPPLIIELGYNTRGSSHSLGLREVFAYQRVKTRNSGHIHPHIQASEKGKLCLGNFFDILNDQNCSVAPDGYQDHILLIENLLHTYNPDSPFIDLSNLIMDATSIMFRDASAEFELVNYSTFTYKNSQLNNNTKQNFLGLIGEKMFRDWYKKLNLITTADIVSDVITVLQNFGEESGSEDWIRLDNLRRTYNSLLKINLTPLDDYTEYEDSDDDGEGGYEIIYNTEELLDKWIVILLAINSADQLVLSLPNLDELFKGVDDVFNKAQ